MVHGKLPNGAPAPSDGRVLDSWKEIASYLGRAVRTVQTWERDEGLPVHRHQHLKAGTVYAYPAEIDAWREERARLASGGAGDADPARRRPRAAAVAAAVLAAAVGAWLILRVVGANPEPNGSRPAAEVRDWLVITGFDNRTGETVLDGTLEAGLRRELAESARIKVAPRERIGDALQLMGRSPDTEIDAELAREVAVRDGGIRAILTGRVEKIGTSYLLSVDVLSAADGVPLASSSEEAAGLDDVLPAVAALSRRVRESLGESLPAIEPAEKLSRVTTPSLRALELYSRADRLLLQEQIGGPEQNQAAEELLREAIAEDPEFASSYTHLAWALRRQGRAASEYLPYAEKATELMDKVTAVERYFIRGSFYFMRSRTSAGSPDLEAALAQYQALLQLDPGHFWAAENAAQVMRHLGRGSEVLELLLALVEARPNDAGFHSRAARELVLTGGGLDRARAHVERARQLQSQLPAEARSRDPFVEFFPVHESWVRGDVEAALVLLDRLVASLDELPAAERRSLAVIAEQHYLDLGMFERANELQRLYSSPDRPFWEWRLAWRRGDGEFIKESIQRRHRKGDLHLAVRAAPILAQFGQTAEAEWYLEQLPADFEFRGWHVLATRGMVALAHGRYQEATTYLERALPIVRHDEHLGFYFYTSRALSRAWEALGRPERGLAVLEEASGLKSGALRIGQWWMEVQLRLAELHREMGAEERARAIEADLRRHCAFADPDFPILRELQRREALYGAAPAATEG